MIGNDVVDLRDPGTRQGATHPRFDARVFAAEERQVLAGADAPCWLRWALWAAKEAAYKVARKRDSRTLFSPRRFVVTLGSGGAGVLRGVVTHGPRRLAVRMHVDAERVHALAGEDEDELAAAFTGFVTGAPDDPGAGDAVREAARRALAPLLGVLPEELEMVREGRVPRLRLRGAPAPFDLSLSHHGRFAAFAALRGAPAR